MRHFYGELGRRRRCYCFRLKTHVHFCVGTYLDFCRCASFRAGSRLECADGNCPLIDFVAACRRCGKCNHRVFCNFAAGRNCGICGYSSVLSVRHFYGELGRRRRCYCFRLKTHVHFCVGTYLDFCRCASFRAGSRLECADGNCPLIDFVAACRRCGKCNHRVFCNFAAGRNCGICGYSSVFAVRHFYGELGRRRRCYYFRLKADVHFCVGGYLDFCSQTSFRAGSCFKCAAGNCPLVNFVAACRICGKCNHGVFCNFAACGNRRICSQCSILSGFHLYGESFGLRVTAYFRFTADCEYCGKQECCRAEESRCFLVENCRFHRRLLLNVFFKGVSP